MYGGQIMREREGMDEPTIDCQCGAPGRFEIQLQELTEAAEWGCLLRGVRCDEHLGDDLPWLLKRVETHQRIVLMPL